MIARNQGQRDKEIPHLITASGLPDRNCRGVMYLGEHAILDYNAGIPTYAVDAAPYVYSWCLKHCPSHSFAFLRWEHYLSSPEAVEDANKAAGKGHVNVTITAVRHTSGCVFLHPKQALSMRLW